MTSRVSREAKRQVAERAGFRCEHCRSPSRFLPVPMSVEHILARARLGSNELENLALACQGCNAHKWACVEAFDEVSGATIPLFNPRQQRWEDHFAWSEDFTRVIAKTAIGRVTLARLQLNRVELVDFRRVLGLAGVHPPDPDERQITSGG